MKQKELKNLAHKMAELEIRMHQTADLNEQNVIATEMMNLTRRVTSFEELDLLDEMIQEILEKNS